jgi:hypothetical protein
LPQIADHIVDGGLPLHGLAENILSTLSDYGIDVATLMRARAKLDQITV